MFDLKNIKDTTPELMLEEISFLLDNDVSEINIVVSNIVFNLYFEKIQNKELFDFWMEVFKLI